MDRTSGDGAKYLLSQLDRTAHAWNTPTSWTGKTHMGGAAQYPAEVAGGLITIEFTVHAWDLARATDTEATWDTGTLNHTLVVVTRTAATGRERGAFAVEVPATEGSPTLARTIAKIGRDPRWHP
ncbi:hypothetical protein EIL87_15265 [Saccharopolyspora rhizosphaerae]|uniref:TIGR03086 family protein n=1 Tax=Saccharopolyspora rhizosphaerae TaxID=2492662 RepID=A0A3R8NY34_9PSEU|nr:hypothetical protein [Saccharopolyspora rhizosphaerae]RRO15423.1 hypothetical protein EIL87_15265 [Saccharopolyspora rhizosphaerae]